ncbi:MAG: tryptophan 7-halogenase, partial [Gammaproteobacteria bacterium]|nr:tryptophan 7-halogenase [Gammaproteobacteria bacterium]
MAMNRATRKVVVVGGGTAGWITANVVANECRSCDVVAVEYPDIPTIGVGEGTCPRVNTEAGERLFQPLGGR